MEAFLLKNEEEEGVFLLPTFSLLIKLAHSVLRAWHPLVRLSTSQASLF